MLGNSGEGKQTKTCSLWLLNGHLAGIEDLDDIQPCLAYPFYGHKQVLVTGKCKDWLQELWFHPTLKPLHFINVSLFLHHRTCSP